LPSNLEIKAKIDNISSSEEVALKVGANYIETMEQVDTYYNISYGKLKLREFSNKDPELIYYDRYGDERWQSDYIVAEISDPKNLKKILSLLFEVKVTVKKKRKLYMFDNARIHLDVVEGLGSFIEFEVVNLRGDKQAKDLLEKLIIDFKIDENIIVRSSYSDLLIDV
jgi:predicted adenylyl cyclase CyaB